MTHEELYKRYKKTMGLKGKKISTASYVKWIEGEHRRSTRLLHQILKYWEDDTIGEEKMLDVSEFEARVAAKLSRKDFDSDIRCSKCPSIYKGTRCKHDANACRLLHARILVEEEMDG